MELFSYEKEKRKKNRKKREREKGKQLILKFTSTVNTIHGARERPGRAGNLSTSTTSSLSSRRGDFRVTRDHVLAKHACFAAESNGSVIESAIRPERLIGMQWCIAIYIYIHAKLDWCWWPVVYGASSLRLKQTIGMQGERGLSIQALERNAEKADVSRQKISASGSLSLSLSLWPSGSLPGSRYSPVGLLLRP